VMLNPQLRYLGFNCRRNFPLSLRNLSSRRLVRSNNVEGAPSQHARYGIEIRGVGVTTDPCRFKGDGAGAAERIRYLWPMAETCDAQLFGEFRNRARISTQMPIHVGPDLGQ